MDYKKLSKVADSVMRNKHKVKDAEGGWYGTPLRMIWHGTNADPELTDGKRVCNYYDVEDALWDYFKEDTGSTDEKEFEKWMESHVDDAMEYFNNACGNEE